MMARPTGTSTPASHPAPGTETPSERAALPEEEARNPLVSVVIPVYNAAQTMPVVLEALDRSECRDFETVIVHDCSTDNTGEVLAQLKQIYPFRLIEFPENRGVSKARNTGAREARGDIILFIDADCIVQPETIGRCVEHLRRNGESCIGGAYTKRAWDRDFFSNFQSLYIHHVETKNEQPDYVATHCMAIWKKTFMDFEGFKEDYFIGHAASVEDVELSHRLVAAGHGISRPRGVEVQHIFRFNFAKSVRNAIKKSKYWTMYSLENKDLTKDSGAASYELKINVITQSLIALLVATAAVTGMWWLLLFAIPLYLLNLIASFRLLGMIREEQGWWFLARAMAYYQFVYPYVVAYGSFLGMAKYFWEVKLLKRYA